MNFSALYEFTDEGMAAFEKAFTGQLDESAIDPKDSFLAQKIPGTKEFFVKEFPNTKAMAGAILSAAGSCSFLDLVQRNGLWAWLTFVLRDALFPKDSDGHRKFGEVHRWYPSNPNDYQKGQRHLVRMPVLLLSSLGDNADHLLCGSPSVLPEIREQLTSQQDMFHPAFQGAARALYYDDATSKLKRGAGGKDGGSPRRLATLRKQLDVTWDLYNLTPQKLISLLPKEFDRYKRDAA